jgi:radical SAM protein with 4Fe4S-binding SPASM domain
MKLQHPEVRYEVTDHCNANCIMCPRDSHTRIHGIMDQSAYEASIDEITSLGATQVVLTGFGEPMLDRKLEQKIRYAKSKGLRTYIITNGSAITPKRAAGLLMAGLDEMRVSFYGMETGTYNAVMRGLDFDKTVKNLMHFLAVRQSLDIDCKVQLSYLVLQENEKDVDEFIRFWEPKVDYLEVWKPHNFGDGKDYRQRIGIKKSCGRPDNGPLQIQWDGTVIPCCYDYNNQIVLGNAFKDSIPDILRGKKYQDLRDAHRNGEFHRYPYCDQCDQLLEHSDALVYTNRHDLPASEAVKLSNTDLYNLTDAIKFEVKII